MCIYIYYNIWRVGQFYIILNGFIVQKSFFFFFWLFKRLDTNMVFWMSDQLHHVSQDNGRYSEIFDRLLQRLTNQNRVFQKAV